MLVPNSLKCAQKIFKKSIGKKQRKKMQNTKNSATIIACFNHLLVSHFMMFRTARNYVKSMCREQIVLQHACKLRIRLNATRSSTSGFFHESVYPIRHKGRLELFRKSAAQGSPPMQLTPVAKEKICYQKSFNHFVWIPLGSRVNIHKFEITVMLFSRA